VAPVSRMGVGAPAGGRRGRRSPLRV